MRLLWNEIPFLTEKVMKLADRTLTRAIQQVSDTFPVVLLTGPRQVGKTTLLEYCAQAPRTYVSMDSFLARELAEKEPLLFIERYQPPVTVDEIQYVPSLFPTIKITVDSLRQNGLFWLTGSQPFHLMKNISESLAGRVAILNLLGLSLKERCDQADLSQPFLPTEQYVQASQSTTIHANMLDIYQFIWRGSFPTIALNGSVDHSLFYDAYMQTYVQRDVKDLAHIGDEQAFVKFVQVAAARTAQILNLNDMARDVGVDPKTAKHWLSILQASGLVYLLNPYHTNLTKRLSKRPKLYFLDTGLCCYLTRWTSANALEAGAMSGALLETFIFSEILKSYWHNAKPAHFYFYRDKDQKEIDLLIEENGLLYPIEFKKTASPNKSMTKHFSVLDKLDKPVGQGAIVCFVKEYIPITNRVYAIPINAI